MTSTDPGNALFNVFCQNEYFEKIFLTEKIRFFFLRFSRTYKMIYFFSKEATSQNKAFCTTPQWNSFLFLFCFLFLFSAPFRFIQYGDKLEHGPFGIFPNGSDKHFQPTLATNLLTRTNVCRQAFLQCRATCQTIKMPCSRQSSGWSAGVCITKHQQLVGQGSQIARKHWSVLIKKGEIKREVSCSCHLADYWYHWNHQISTSCSYWDIDPCLIFIPVLTIITSDCGGSIMR